MIVAIRCRCRVRAGQARDPGPGTHVGIDDHTSPCVLGRTVTASAQEAVNVIHGTAYVAGRSSGLVIVGIRPGSGWHNVYLPWLARGH